MRMRALVLSCLLAVTAGGASDVFTFTNSNWESSKPSKSSDVYIIKFYAPWCGHCKKLAPTWEMLGTTLKERHGTDKMKYIAAKVDCAGEGSKIGDEFGIKSFPTIIRVASDGTRLKHKGPRELGELVQFTLTGEGGAGVVGTSWFTQMFNRFVRQMESLGPLNFGLLIVLGMMMLLFSGFTVGFMYRKHEIAPIDLQFSGTDPIMKLGLMVLDPKYTVKTGKEIGSKTSPDSHFYVSRDAGDQPEVGKNCFEIPPRMQFRHLEPENKDEKEKKED